MDYGLIKTLHIVSATVLFGTGLGTAFFLWSAHRTKDVRVIAGVARLVVRADWVFTTPAIIIQPLSGFWLVNEAGYSWTSWVAASIVLFTITGACWLPVVWLQLRMRKLAGDAAHNHSPLPSRYYQYAQIWFWLGVPAFISVLVIFYLMAVKPAGLGGA